MKAGLVEDLRHMVKMVRASSLESTFELRQSPPVINIGQTFDVSEPASRDTSFCCMGLHLPLQRLRHPYILAHEGSPLEMQPLNVGEKGLWASDRPHS